MADKDTIISALRAQSNVIKTERKQHANTAERIGSMFLAIIDALEGVIDSEKLFSLKQDSDGLWYIHTPYSLASDGALSSLGIGPSANGSIGAMYQLADVLSDGERVAGATDGNILTYKDGKWQGIPATGTGSTNESVNLMQVTSDILPVATNTYNIGSQSLRFGNLYATVLDVSRNITIGGESVATQSDISTILGSKITIAGTEISLGGNITVDTLTRSLGIGTLAYKNGLAFSELANKPTTLAGYGITDAYTQVQTTSAITAAEEALKQYADGKYLPLTGGTLTGSLVPATNASYDLGTSELKWNTIYGKELHAGVGIYAGGSIYTHGKTSDADGKSGTILGYNGLIHIAGPSPAIRFYFNNAVSPTVQLQATDSNTLSCTKNFNLKSGNSLRWDNFIVLRNNGNATILSSNSDIIYFRPIDTSSATAQMTYTPDGLLTAPSVKVTTLQIGDATITWDTTNGALKFNKAIYSTSAVSSLGAGTSGGSTGSGSADWSAVPTDILPVTGGNYSLGSEELRWKAVYADEIYSGEVPIISLMTDMQTILGNATSDIYALQSVVTHNSSDIITLKESVTALQQSTFSGTENSDYYRLTWFTSSGGGRNADIPTYSGKGFASIEDIDGVFLADYKMVYDILDYVDAAAGGESVDLSGYYTKTAVDNLLAGYATTSALLSYARLDVSNDFNGTQYFMDDAMVQGTLAATSVNANAIRTTSLNMDGDSEGSLMDKQDNYTIRFGFGQLYAMLVGYNDTLDTWSIDSESGCAWFSDDVSAASFQQTSDLTQKDVHSYAARFGVNDIANAPIAYFTWKDRRDTTTEHIGTTAQYWKHFCPQCVKGNEGDMSLDYATLGVVTGIINARRIVEHENRMAALEKENEILRNKIAALEGVA